MILDITGSYANILVTILVMCLVISVFIGLISPAVEEHRRKQKLRNRKRGNKK